MRKWHIWTLGVQNTHRCWEAWTFRWLLLLLLLKGFLQPSKEHKCNHGETWCIIETENSVGIWRKVNFIHKGVKRKGGRGDPRLRKWATEAAMCAGAAVKSAWSNRFCLSGTTTSESKLEIWGRFGGGWDSGREGRQKSNTVCSTVWQSSRSDGDGGFFLPNSFTIQAPRLLFWSPFLLPSTCCCASLLPFHAVALCSLSDPPNAASIFLNTETPRRDVSLTVLLESCNSCANTSMAISASRYTRVTGFKKCFIGLWWRRLAVSLLRKIVLRKKSCLKLENKSISLY